MLLHMRIIDTCLNANLFPVKKYKNRVITIFNCIVCPLGPSKSLILYTYSVYLHNICKWEAGSRGGGGGGGTYVKIKDGYDPFY